MKGIKKSFAAACREAGLSAVMPYTLRHTGATLLAASGVPLWQISGLLGHSIARTTEIYAKHSPEFMKQATESMERQFGLEALGFGSRANHAPDSSASRQQ